VKKVTVIAEFSIIPVGTGDTSIGNYVAEAIKVLEKEGLDIEVTPMGTIIESENLSDILRAVERAHQALVNKGIRRVVSTLKIDDRRDKPRRKEDKVKRVKIGR
jgi:uncharacterized protein (TIGR00106 family)